MPRKGRKRLTIDLPTVLFNQVKLMAQRRNITMTRYVIKLIFEAMQRERDLEG